MIRLIDAVLPELIMTYSTDSYIFFTRACGGGGGWVGGLL